METDWWKRPGGLAISVSSMAWNPELVADEISPYMEVSVMLPVTSTVNGRYFTKRCENPQQLWDLIQALDRSPEKTLIEEFNYHGRSGEVRPNCLSGVNLDKLLEKLKEMGIEE